MGWRAFAQHCATGFGEGLTPFLGLVAVLLVFGIIGEALHRRKRRRAAEARFRRDVPEPFRPRETVRRP